MGSLNRATRAEQAVSRPGAGTRLPCTSHACHLSVEAMLQCPPKELCRSSAQAHGAHLSRDWMAWWEPQAVPLFTRQQHIKLATNPHHNQQQTSGAHLSRVWMTWREPSTSRKPSQKFFKKVGFCM